MMACDVEFHHRLELLADLMERSPNKLVRKLQWEALKFYPLASKEAIRSWMKIRVAFLAADIANKRLME